MHEKNVGRRLSEQSLPLNERFATLLQLGLLTALAFLVMGYHPGAEDDAVYLAAVKVALQPRLYAHDADFVRLQTQATLFVPAMASFVRMTRIPLAWAELAWQVLSLFGILAGALAIARQLFREPRAHWAGVTLLALLFTMPVAGTALYIADQHLHPRNIATAVILFAVAGVMRRRIVRAVVLLCLAFLVHPIMAAFGASLCGSLAFTQSSRLLRRTRALKPAAMAVPLGWILEPPSASWRQALSTRDYYFLDRWHWYDWLGALAPLALFWSLHRWSSRTEDERLSRFALGVLLYGVFQQVAAILILENPALVRLTPLQPMRYLQLVYVLMVVIGGCLLGQHVLKGARWRWFALIVAGAIGMWVPQRVLFAGTEHIEWPGRVSRSEWLQAFAWIRQNTPEDAYFALDPKYLAATDNDAHGFRALAERSQLADAIKDPAVVTQVPRLGPEWVREQQALAGWDQFTVSDFIRLQAEFGVTWTLIKYPAAANLECVWHNAALTVCRIPTRH